MASVKQAEVVVLGAGPAGYVCAIRLAQLGKKVVVIDQAEVGGVCLNRGCIPSKALIHAGTLYDRMSHLNEIGIEVSGSVKLNFPKLIEWKGQVVKKLTSGIAQLLKANGCEFVAGTAQFLNANSLQVKTVAGVQTIQFQNLVVATGSRPAPLKGFSIDQKFFIDSTGALDEKSLPKRLLCIGGGYIGLELGIFYSKVGSAVTVCEAGADLLGSVDPELSAVVEKKCTKRGMKIHKKTIVRSAKVIGQEVECELDQGGKIEKVRFDKVLVTIGRIPNSDHLQIEKSGVRLDAKGFIQVDPARRTSQSHIFAIGDVAGQPLLAHKGSKEGIVAAEALAGKKTIYDVVAMPAVVFTDPEVATVGLSEAEAKAKGLSVKIGKFPFAANGRALSVNEPDGFVKVVGDAKTGRLLGVHIVGVEASNLIAEAALALEMGAQVDDLALTVHAHPTLPETLMEAAESALGHAIHIFERKK